MHIPHPTSLYVLLSISYRNYQKSVTYCISVTWHHQFCFFTKSQGLKRGAWLNAPPYKYAHVCNIA